MEENPENEVKCELCMKKVKNKNRLKSHKKLIHGTPYEKHSDLTSVSPDIFQSKLSKKDIKENDNERSYVPNEIDEKASTNSALEEHIDKV